MNGFAFIHLLLLSFLGKNFLKALVNKAQWMVSGNFLFFAIEEEKEMQLKY